MPGPSLRTFSTWTSASRSCSIHSPSWSPTSRTHQAERVAAAAGDAGVDEGVEHPPLGHAQPGHHRHAQAGEDAPPRRRSAAPHATLRPKRASASSAMRIRVRAGVLPEALDAGPARRPRVSSSASSPASGSASAPDHEDLVAVVGRPSGGPVNQPSGRRPANQPWSLASVGRGVAGVLSSAMVITVLHRCALGKRLADRRGARAAISASSAYFVRGQKKPRRPSFRLRGTTCTWRCGHALAHDVVLGDERPVGPHRRPAPRRRRAAPRRRTASTQSASSRSRRVTTCARGTTSVWPGNSGRWSRNATTSGVSSTTCVGRSPADDRAEEAGRRPWPRQLLGRLVRPLPRLGAASRFGTITLRRK